MSGETWSPSTDKSSPVLTIAVTSTSGSWARPRRNLPAPMPPPKVTTRTFSSPRTGRTAPVEFKGSVGSEAHSCERIAFWLRAVPGSATEKCQQLGLEVCAYRYLEALSEDAGDADLITDVRSELPVPADFSGIQV